MAEKGARSSMEDRWISLMTRLRRLGPGLPPLEGVQVTPAQLILLDWIASSPGCRLREMADGLDLTSPTVSVGVRKLEEAGLVGRQPDPKDRRAVRLFLTAKGEALYQKVQEFRRRKARKLLAGLSPQEQETLLNLLERAISAAEESRT